MSGIYIPGVEMPKNCDDCDLMTVAGEYGEPTCPFGRIIRCASELHPDCPLVFVPEHGRTIDADAFKKRMIQGAIDAREDTLTDEIWRHILDATKCLCLDVDEQPTIIPADGRRRKREQ